MEIKKILMFFLALILLFASLPSCAEREPVTCRKVLNSMISSEIGIPAGMIYDLSAAEGDDAYLEERVINSLFGDGATPPMRNDWLDLALFLPTSSHPCEFAVFLCNSPDTATDTARMLCRRLDIVKSAKNKNEYSEMLESASVTIMGNYVLLIISSDSALSLRAAREIIK